MSLLTCRKCWHPAQAVGESRNQLGQRGVLWRCTWCSRTFTVWPFALVNERRSKRQRRGRAVTAQDDL